MRTRLPLWTLIAAATATGCAEFRAPTTWFGPDMPTETVKNPVQRIVAVWQAAEGPGLDGFPGRGFSGQILFFPHKGEEAVKVEGDVRIYVFDDQGTAEEQARPVHQFDFPEGSLNKQLVAGSLGPTYQVFIPYTRKGLHHARCSIRMRYSPKVGPAVYSEVIAVTLPGGEKGRDEAIVSVPRRSVPRQSNGDDVDTIRLERARRTPGRLDEIQQTSGEAPAIGDRPDDSARGPAVDASVESAQAAYIAELERKLAALAATEAPRREAIVGDASRETFVDRAEASSPVRSAAFDRPAYEPIDFSLPPATSRFGHTPSGDAAARTAPRPAFDPRADQLRANDSRQDDPRPNGVATALQPAAAPSIRTSLGSYEDRFDDETGATATSGASPRRRFRLTGSSAEEPSPRPLGAQRFQQTEPFHPFDGDSGAWSDVSDADRLQEIR